MENKEKFTTESTEKANWIKDKKGERKLEFMQGNFFEEELNKLRRDHPLRRVGQSRQYIFNQPLNETITLFSVDG